MEKCKNGGLSFSGSEFQSCRLTCSLQLGSKTWRVRGSCWTSRFELSRGRSAARMVERQLEKSHTQKPLIVCDFVTTGGPHPSFLASEGPACRRITSRVRHTLCIAPRSVQVPLWFQRLAGRVSVSHCDNACIYARPCS